MRNWIAIILLGLMTLSCNSSKVKQKTVDEKYFNVEIVQDGKIIKAKNGIVQLAKKPFKYKLTFIKTTNIYVSNSWGTHYYDYPTHENIFKCDEESAEGINNICRFVAIKTGNEDQFNANKDIYVGNKGYHGVWFYEEHIDWHRMDKEVIVKDGVTYAEVTVENIFDLDKRDEGNHEKSEYDYPIEKINQDIYAVFATSHYEKGMEHPKELQRAKFILRFK